VGVATTAGPGGGYVYFAVRMDDELLGARRHAGGNYRTQLVRQIPRRGSAFPAAKGAEGGRGGALLNEQGTNACPVATKPQKMSRRESGLTPSAARTGPASTKWCGKLGKAACAEGGLLVGRRWLRRATLLRRVLAILCATGTTFRAGTSPSLS